MKVSSVSQVECTLLPIPVLEMVKPMEMIPEQLIDMAWILEPFIKK